MNKQWYKDRIYGYECKVISLIAAELHTVPKKALLQKCRILLSDFSDLVKLDRVEFVGLWNWTVSLYNRMSKASWGDRSKIPAAGAKEYRAMELEKNAIADRIEFRIKHSFYSNMNSVFYRCSSHTNCAEGHKPYQGKIYINKDLASQEELDYATRNGIMDIREVMAAPVWLYTRKNCKHFFTPVPSELVMENKLPPEKIINDQDLNSPYRAYYDRKKLLEAVGISKKNDSMKRTVMLINKYKR